MQFAGYFSVVGFAFVGGVIQFAPHVAGLCVPVVGGSPPVAFVGFLFVGVVVRFAGDIRPSAGIGVLSAGFDDTI